MPHEANQPSLKKWSIVRLDLRTCPLGGARIEDAKHEARGRVAVGIAAAI